MNETHSIRRGATGGRFESQRRHRWKGAGGRSISRVINRSCSVAAAKRANQTRINAGLATCRIISIKTQSAAIFLFLFLGGEIYSCHGNGADVHFFVSARDAGVIQLILNRLRSFVNFDGRWRALPLSVRRVFCGRTLRLIIFDSKDEL